jgi:hypothetical protein
MLPKPLAKLASLIWRYWVRGWGEGVSWRNQINSMYIKVLPKISHHFLWALSFPGPFLFVEFTTFKAFYDFFFK